MNKTLLKIILIINPIFLWGIGNMAIMFIMQTIYPIPTTSFENGQPSFTIEYSVHPFHGYVVLALSIYLSIKLWVKHVENVK